jgi:hypothetical protein
MEGHAYAQAHWHPQRASVVTTTVVRVGALAGLLGSVLLRRDHAKPADVSLRAS